ncbi:MMPL family transporter [Streptomyces capparidis]
MPEVNQPPSGEPVTAATAAGRARLRGWSRVATARPWLSLVLALVFVVLAVVAGRGVEDRMAAGGWAADGAESSRAGEVLDREFPAARPNLLLLVRAEPGVDDPAAAAEGRALARGLAGERGVAGATSYWETGSPGLRSDDGRQALIAARVEGDEKQAQEVLERIAPRYRGGHGPVEVSVGGSLAVGHEMTEVIQEDLVRAELIALPITLLLLVMVFGSAVAALLPLAVGIVAILGTSAILRGLTEVTEVSVFAQNLTTALGLGLAIDYALFIVRRFREELPGAASPREAVAATLRTAGRTVLFSALTVAVSLAAMMVFPQYFLRSFAYAGIAVVLLAALAALVVLPAALVLLGDRVNAWDLRRLLRRGAAPGDGREPGQGYARLARTVMRRAPLFAVGTATVLVVLGLPFLGVRFGSADARELPGGAESRVVQEQVEGAFSGSPGGAVEVLATGAVDEGMAGYVERLSALPGVLRVDSPAGEFRGGELTGRPGPAEQARLSGRTAHLTVHPSGQATDSSAQDLVRAVRAADGDTPFETLVAGDAAVLVDTKDSIADRLPYALAMIVLTTLVLVFLLTGSVLIPVQAVVLNALSLTAMFGAVVWVFQDGNLSGLLGFTPTGFIETTLPVLMFCLAFGLSMDYGVFLLSRIKEEHERTGDHTGAVVFGVQRTGGLITAAAVILAVVLTAIGTSRVTNTKMLGLGVALAVLMDAMVVRGLLVPAVMRLTGEATWWAPRSLRRLHRRFGISEGPRPEPRPRAEDREPARTG